MTTNMQLDNLRSYARTAAVILGCAGVVLTRDAAFLLKADEVLNAVLTGALALCCLLLVVVYVSQRREISGE